MLDAVSIATDEAVFQSDILAVKFPPRNFKQRH